MHKPGERVGALLSSNSEQVKLLGYGEFVGDVVPDRPIGLMGDYETWEAVAEMMNEGDARPMEGGDWTADRVKIKNPLLRLDSGAEVWGAECWWDSEEKVRSAVDAQVSKGAELVEVDPRTVEGMQAHEAAHA